MSKEEKARKARKFKGQKDWLKKARSAVKKKRQKGEGQGGQEEAQAKAGGPQAPEPSGGP